VKVKQSVNNLPKTVKSSTILGKFGQNFSEVG